MGESFGPFRQFNCSLARDHQNKSSGLESLVLFQTSVAQVPALGAQMVFSLGLCSCHIGSAMLREGGFHAKRLIQPKRFGKPPATV